MTLLREDFYSTFGQVVALWFGFFCFGSSPLNFNMLAFGIGLGLIFWLILIVTTVIARKYRQNRTSLQ